ncbi:2-dehydropantoate 2-reductase [Phytohabitans sp. ZYX-F-186]|uniref:2-dehydropantoate 2-reductase n=1 Tax=Phytohabitans maris TaxID=3071409 RepID=A0ABU0ZPV1_9ACTN|nr:2-dehydropantoate 2-reductase [Phytohabitans sp. ZYX-F-186]MDQ7909056.1 2-dehydropantoate 2-reductase [Phytohabitans sp. ZYX-F-186]
MPPSNSSAESAAGRVLVVGAGAIGGLIAAKLAEAPGATILIAAQRPIERFTFTPLGGEPAEPDVTVVREPSELPGPPGLSWVVVATKTYDVGGVGRWLGRPAVAGATVVVAQNGVGHHERLAPFVDPGRIVPALVTYGAGRTGPGQVVHTLDGVLRVPAGPGGEGFAALAAPTSLKVEVVTDFAAAQWTKLAYNLVGNSISTITDLPVREIGRRPELRRIATALVDEARKVAATQSAALPADLAERMLDEFAAYPDTVRSSMWQDRQAGRPLEHDAISGAVARVARSHNIDAPFSQMATDLLETLSPVRAPAPPVPRAPST